MEDNSAPHDLHKFMAQVSREMASEYERIYARAAEDPGTAGDEGEENWATLFREWLPPTYHVQTKGRLIGHDGSMSPQVDVVVLKPTYPRKLLEKKVWLAGGVAAAFECKTTLTSAHVKEALKRSAQCKALFAQRVGSPRSELRSPLVFGLLAHSHLWKADASEPIANIEAALAAGSGDIEHPRFELDFICVADLATWSSMYIARYEASWSSSTTELAARFGAKCGPMTSMICSAASLDRQEAHFQPVGALLNGLTEELGWSDPGVRDIARYYLSMNLGGSGGGSMRPWPLSSYSPQVAKQVELGRLSNGVFWDEWSLHG